MTKQDAIQKLTPRQQELIRLRDTEKLKWKDVGAAVSLTPEYAQQQYKKAKVELAGFEAVQIERVLVSDEVQIEGNTYKSTDGIRHLVVKHSELPLTPPTSKPSKRPVLATGVAQKRTVAVTGVVVPNPDSAPLDTKSDWLKSRPVSVTIRS